MTRARQPLPPLAPNYNLLNIEEVAKLLRVSKRTIQRWVLRGRSFRSRSASPRRRSSGGSPPFRN